MRPISFLLHLFSSSVSYAQRRMKLIAHFVAGEKPFEGKAIRYRILPVMIKTGS